jgi:hypothetical protein
LILRGIKRVNIVIEAWVKIKGVSIMNVKIGKGRDAPASPIMSSVALLSQLKASNATPPSTRSDWQHIVLQMEES